MKCYKHSDICGTDSALPGILIKMLIPRELLNILKNGNHHNIMSWCLLSINNKTLMLLSQMTEHEWFEGTLSEMALR